MKEPTAAKLLRQNLRVAKLRYVTPPCDQETLKPWANLHALFASLCCKVRFYLLTESGTWPMGAFFE